MWNEIAQGGLGLAGLGIAIKVLWPLLKSRLDADASRAITDSTLHNLYQETLKAQREVFEELKRAQIEIGKLTGQVQRLTEDLARAEESLKRRSDALAT